MMNFKELISKCKISVLNVSGDMPYERRDVESINFSYPVPYDTESDFFPFYDEDLIEAFQWVAGALQNRVKLYEMFIDCTIGEFTRTRRYYGIWKNELFKSIKFSNTSAEEYFSSKRGEIMVAFAEISHDELRNAFAVRDHGNFDAKLFFMKEDMYQKFRNDKQFLLAEDPYNSGKVIIDSLLNHDAAIVSLRNRDVYIEHDLYIYGNKGNAEIKFLKSKLGLR